MFPVHSSIDFLWFLSMTAEFDLSSSLGNSLNSFEAYIYFFIEAQWPLKKSFSFSSLE